MLALVTFWEFTFWEVDILGVDLLGVDISGVDILGRTPSSGTLVHEFINQLLKPNLKLGTERLP